MKRILIAVALAISAWTSHADLFIFYAITSNDPDGDAQLVGETQLFMDATLLGLGQVQLVFSNIGPEDAVVSRIYFDSFLELNLDIVAINNEPGVKFLEGASSPQNLPAGLGMDNVFESSLGLSSQNPAPKNGINAGESFEVIISYDDTYDFIDALRNEDLRVGLHVQSFEGGYSESFVNVIPEPATLPMILLGTTTLRWLRIRKSKRGKNDDSFTPYLADGDYNDLAWVDIKAPKPYQRRSRNRLEATFSKVS